MCNELEKLIKDSGLSKSYITRKLGITYQAFQNKLHGKSPFKMTEVFVIKNLLNITLDDVYRIFIPTIKTEK